MKSGALFLNRLGEILLFLSEVLKTLWKRPCKLELVLEQVWHVMIQSFPTTAMAGFFVGGIMTVQFAMLVSEFGASAYLGGLATSATIREIGPMLIAFMLSGKVGAFTSVPELGTMKVTEQIDAIRCLGADPIQEIILPRFLGIIISSFFLLTGGLMLSVIAPVWYFTPFYSMLRAVTDEMLYVLIAGVVFAATGVVVKGKLSVILKGVVVVCAAAVVAMMLAIDAKFWGVVAMGGGVVILFFLPWLDNSPVKSMRYRPTWHQAMLGVFVLNFLVLGYLGILPPSTIGGRVAQLGTLFYFGFFLLMPWWSKLGEPKQVPDRVTYTAH